MKKLINIVINEHFPTLVEKGKQRWLTDAFLCCSVVRIIEELIANVGTNFVKWWPLGQLAY
jgi:hypothetical protein